MIDRLLEPAVPPRSETNLVQQKGSGMGGIESHRLHSHYFPRRDPFFGQPVVRKIEVRQVPRRPSRIEQIIRRLEQENGLSYLAWAEKKDGPPILHPGDPGEDTLLQVSADRVPPSRAHRPVAPPGILVLENVVEDHRNVPWRPL